MKQLQRLQQMEENMIKFQLDSSDILEILRMDLLGLEYNDDGEPVPSKFKVKKINMEGADTILSFLRPRITKIISLSNLDDDEIRKRCKAYIDDISFLLARHWEEFQIKSFQMMNSIIELCDDVFYTTMAKAFEAGERDTLRKQFTHVESQERVQDMRPQRLPFQNPFSGVK